MDYEKEFIEKNIQELRVLYDKRSKERGEDIPLAKAKINNAADLYNEGYYLHARKCIEEAYDALGGRPVSPGLKIAASVTGIAVVLLILIVVLSGTGYLYLLWSSSDTVEVKGAITKHYDALCIAMKNKDAKAVEDAYALLGNTPDSYTYLKEQIDRDLDWRWDSVKSCDYKIAALVVDRDAKTANVTTSIEITTSGSVKRSTRIQMMLKKTSSDGWKLEG